MLRYQFDVSLDSNDRLILEKVMQSIFDVYLHRGVNSGEDGPALARQARDTGRSDNECRYARDISETCGEDRHGGKVVIDGVE